jgi:hypothetical protein
MWCQPLVHRRTDAAGINAIALRRPDSPRLTVRALGRVLRRTQLAVGKGILEQATAAAIAREGIFRKSRHTCHSRGSSGNANLSHSRLANTTFRGEEPMSELTTPDTKMTSRHRLIVLQLLGAGFMLVVEVSVFGG